MKKVFLPLMLLAAGCMPSTQKVEEQLRQIRKQAVELDSVLQAEGTKLKQLDTLVQDEFAKLKQLDSLVNLERSRVDSIVKRIKK